MEVYIKKKYYLGMLCEGSDNLTKYASKISEGRESGDTYAREISEQLHPNKEVILTRMSEGHLSSVFKVETDRTSEMLKISPDLRRTRSEVIAMTKWHEVEARCPEILKKSVEKDAKPPYWFTMEMIPTASSRADLTPTYATFEENKLRAIAERNFGRELRKAQSNRQLTTAQVLFDLIYLTADISARPADKRQKFPLNTLSQYCYFSFIHNIIIICLLIIFYWLLFNLQLSMALSQEAFYG